MDTGYFFFLDKMNLLKTYMIMYIEYFCNYECVSYLFIFYSYAPFLNWHPAKGRKLTRLWFDNNNFNNIFCSYREANPVHSIRTSLPAQGST